MNIIILFSAVILIYVAIIFAVLRVVKRHEKKHHIRHIVMLLGTAVSSWYLAHFFKNLIALPRPDLTRALFQPLEAVSYGLPSGHAAFMFALAFTMYSFDKKAGHLLLVLAVLSGSARAVAGVHYWYDIVGGAVLGIFVSWIIVTLCKRLIRQW